MYLRNGTLVIVIIIVSFSIFGIGRIESSTLMANTLTLTNITMNIA
jgi:hypothetical protein